MEVKHILGIITLPAICMLLWGNDILSWLGFSMIIGAIIFAGIHSWRKVYRTNDKEQ